MILRICEGECVKVWGLVNARQESRKVGCGHVDRLLSHKA